MVRLNFSDCVCGECFCGLVCSHSTSQPLTDNCASLIPDKDYEFFDHTADVGIRAQGATLAELLEQLARGLVELVAEDSRLEPRQARPIQLTAPDAETLALRWLQELLFWFSIERFLPATYALEAGPTSLRGEVRGDAFDPARHVQGREVKAITRHLLSVEQRDGRWHGQAIVDI